MRKLKRGDLVKQFEQIVQQEIKNHNESILATNVAINSLGDQINSLSNTCAKNLAIQENRFTKLERIVRELEEVYEKHERKTQIQLDNAKNENEAYRQYVDRTIDLVENQSVDEISFNEAIESLKQNMISLGKEINKHKEFIYLQLDKLKTESNQIFNDFKKDLLEKPNELWDVKKELEKKIESSVVDAKGILREIEVHKKSVFIIEKNIEHIYTLFERLKKKDRG